jgi:hypothetical protein
MSLREFTNAYMGALFWSECIKHGPSDGEPFDSHFGPEDLDSDALREIESDCTAFYDGNAALWREAGASDEQAGHDFALTRNRHGAGFWDRPDLYGKDLSSQLTEAAHVYGTMGLDHNDEGRVYTHG